MVMVTESFE